MKKLNIMMIISFLMVVLIACGSDENNNKSVKENNSITNTGNLESDNSENNEDNNYPNDESSDENANSKSSGKFGDGKVLSLGETGVVESTIGDYEITFESFEIIEELDGHKSVMKDGVFVLVDATVEITGEESIEAMDIQTARLFSDNESSVENTFYIESVDIIEGTLNPGDIAEGQFLFSIAPGNTYELVLNFGLDGVATEITWEFDADEASN